MYVEHFLLPPPPALPMTTFCTLPSLPTHIWNFFFSFFSRYWVQFVLAVLGVMPSLACGQPTRGHIVKQNWLSPSSFQINANSSPTSGGLLCLLLHLHSGILSALCLGRSYASCYSYYEIKCAIALLCLENTVFFDVIHPTPQVLRNFLLPLPPRSPRLGDGGYSVICMHVLFKARWGLRCSDLWCDGFSWLSTWLHVINKYIFNL